MLFVFFLFHFLFSLPSPLLLLHALRILCVNPVVLCEHSKRLTPDGRTGGSSSSSAAAADVIAVNKKRTIYSFIHFSFLSKLSKVKLEGNDAAQLSSWHLTFGQLKWDSKGLFTATDAVLTRDQLTK